MKRTILAFVMLLPLHAIFAQGNHSVNPLTGTLGVGIPLFSVGNGDVSVEGVLTYSANGAKVTEDGGWVGQNWGLSVQGYGITRQMRNLPDDYSGTSPDNRRGWLRSTTSLPTNIKNFTPSTDGNPATCTDEVANYNFLNTAGYTQDTEPDVFNVNAPGLSFRFYFDENKAVQVVPYHDVVVTPNTVTGTITSFVVTDDKGVQYTFNELETITESAQAANAYYLVRQSNMLLTPITYHTGWKLTKIMSPIYGTLDFTYRQVSSADNNLTPAKSKLKYKYPVTFTNASTANSQLTFNRSLIFKIPLKVISPTMEVQFVSSTTDGTKVGLLERVEVYEKRYGGLILRKLTNFTYSSYNGRTFLQVVLDRDGPQTLQPNIYNLEYYGGALPTEPAFPTYNSTNKDAWDFFKMPDGIAGFMAYDETAARGTLKKITYPHKGYTVFFYEPNEYMQASVAVRGAGIRVSKVVSFDGVSTTGDMVTEYEYKTAGGQTSGKLQQMPETSVSVVRVDRYFNGSSTIVNARYRDIQLANPGLPVSTLNGYFTVKSSEELSGSDLVVGSAVAYERVTEKVKDGGSVVFEFDLPASYGDETANSGEWSTSKMMIARPSGGSFCFDVGPLVEGSYKYPYAPDPNYGFARGLLKKETHYREDGIKRKEVVYEYQNIYGTTAINKIYGLALEELPTYYYNGSAYVDGKLFVFSKYHINTGVKKVVKKKTETIFLSTDLSKKVENIVELFYSTGNHREVERIVQTGSDLIPRYTRLKYVRDYAITTPADAQATAIKNLQTAHRTNLIVESITSKIIGGVEKYTGAALSYYQTIGGKVYPHKQFVFNSAVGTTAFTPSTSTSTAFTYDATNYVLAETFLSFNAFGDVKESVGRDKVVKAGIYPVADAPPVIIMNNAKVQEFLYSDFEAVNDVSFTTPWNPVTAEGRHGSKGIVLPISTGGPNYMVKGVTNITSQNYTFSCWLKPTSAGTISVKLTGNVTATFTLPFTGSTMWKYHALLIPIPATMTSTGFSVEVRSSVAVPIDDAAFFPTHARFVARTYAYPFGKTIETDEQGNASYITYDSFGRVTLIADQDGNILKKTDYQLKP